MEVHESKYGASRQSWDKISIRTIYTEIKAQYPRYGHAALVRLLIDRMILDEEAIEAAADYIVTNLETSIARYTATNKESAAPQKPKVDLTPVVEAIKTQILLLNLEMPNGKRMRYCTGAEMNNFGMAYRRIAKKVGNTKMVGSVLNEKQVRELL